MARSKASAYRSGQRRALRDMRDYIQQVRDTVNALHSIAGADQVRTQAMRDTLNRAEMWTWELDRRVCRG